jgi:putative ABC transport system permease protein
MLAALDDLRQAVRSLTRAPLLALFSISILAIGIGGTVAIFGLVWGVVLKPLPFADASQLVAIETSIAGPDLSGGFSSYLDFADWLASSTTIDRMAAYASGTVTLTGTSDPIAVPAAFVSDALVPILGARPIAGALLPEGADRSALPVVLMSETLWRDRFSASPSIVGHEVTLDGRGYTVAGILPAAFNFPVQSDRIGFWIPLGSHPSTAIYKPKRASGFLHVIGRLRAGVTVAQAQADLAATAARLAAAYPLSNSNKNVTVWRLRDLLVREYRLQMLLLMAAAATVLVTTCANLAHLLITRGLDRRRELAIRSAIGAGRSRLVGQLFAEAIVIAAAAGALGLLLASWGTTAFVAILPADVPRVHDVTIDRIVLACAAIATACTAFLFGAVPAWQLSEVDAVTALKEATASTARGARAVRVAVVAEVSISLALLITAALLGRSLIALQHVSPGFRPDHLSMIELSLPDTRYPAAANQITFFRRLHERLASEPGVRASAVSTTLPLSGSDLGAAFTIEGRPAPTHGGYWVAPYFSVSADFFRTLAIPLLGGREFTDRDDERAPLVVIISDSLARQYFGGDDPIGKRLSFGFGPRVARTVVGVVGDVKQRELSQKFQPQIYTPFAQTPWPFITAIVRVDGSAAIAAGALRQALKAVDRDQPGEVKTMDDYLARSTATPSIVVLLVVCFGALTVALAAAGLYSVMAQTVARRRRELAIRLALGAQPIDIGRMVVREAVTLGLVGVTGGVVAALAAGRVVRRLLYGVGAADPITFAVVPLLVLAVTIAATIAPTRRSLRTNPIEALRAPD